MATARVTQLGAASTYSNGSTISAGFSLSTPAGWTMIWWGLATVLIILTFLAL